jgi:hypothetical protein
MSKALRIKIINYLRENDAVAKYIDVRAHVLQDTDSVAERNEFKATLDYLSNNRLIAINGSYEFLHWTVNYGLYNLDGKVIAAKLTKAGQSYHPENESDDMEAFVPPVLAVIKKRGDEKKQSDPTGFVLDEVATLSTEKAEPLPWYVAPTEEPFRITENTSPSVEPEALPWYVAPAEEEASQPIENTLPAVEPEPLPWYVAPVEEEVSQPTEKTSSTVEAEPLPWYVAPAEEVSQSTENTSPMAETEPLPWYVAPKEEVSPVIENIEPPVEKGSLPWYTEEKHDDSDVFESEMLSEAPEVRTGDVPITKTHVPDEPEQEKPKLTAFQETLKALESYEPLQPWYVESTEQKSVPILPEPSVPKPVITEPSVPEPVMYEASKPEPVQEPVNAKPALAPIEPEVKLPWDTETVASEPVEERQPVIYRFPPLELKPEIVAKPSPMVIERLNENLSHGIDVISNIKLKKPAVLTGDFEKDTNVILKFVLVIVLFLLFGCIVWLYLG